MDVETIPATLFVVGAFALFVVLLRRLPPAEDDVAVVVTAILRPPVELDRPFRGPGGACPMAPRLAQAARGRPVAFRTTYRTACDTNLASTASRSPAPRSAQRPL